jgi:hypothetical protein
VRERGGDRYRGRETETDRDRERERQRERERERESQSGTACTIKHSRLSEERKPLSPARKQCGNPLADLTLRMENKYDTCWPI